MTKLKNYFKKAEKEKWAIGQFNFSTLEHLRGILGAAEKLNSPVILGTTERGIKFLGMEEIIALVNISKRKYNVGAFLHLDHGKDLKLIKKAVGLGYQTVHFDGSRLPFGENKMITKQIVRYAHKRGALVEGEIGQIFGSSVLHQKRARIKRKYLTSPEEVAEFIKETRVDSLAISIGNIHGVYSRMPKLDLELLKEIKKVAKAFLVLHGSSGFPDEEVKKAVKSGIVKAIFSTELRMAWKKSLAVSMKTKEFKPYNILPKVQDAIQKKVEEKIKLLGSSNKL